MKERIYTIPINEAFDQDTECPLCICERKLESDALDYTLGPAMMEPDSRIATNRMGFCSTHFAKLYNLQQNRLPLALIIDTHMAEQIRDIEEIYKKYGDALKKESEIKPLDSVLSVLKGKNVSGKAIAGLLEKLENLESTCAVCDKLKSNMERLVENTLYLYNKESDFREKFNGSKGFCLKHLKMLAAESQNQLPASRRAEFLNHMLQVEIENLERVHDDVGYFIKMFDYRNRDADWKNSRDAVPRSIEKLCGPCDLKR
jgi:hypothetical protein